MAKIEKSEKLLKEISKTLEVVAKQFTEIAKNSENVNKVVDQNTKKSKNFEKSVENTSKSFNDLLDTATEFSDLDFKKNNLKSIIKNVSELDSAFSAYGKEIKKLDDSYNKLGVSSNLAFSSLLKKSNEVQKSVEEITTKTTTFIGLRKKLLDFADPLKSFGEAGEDSVGKVKSTLEDLKKSELIKDTVAGPEIEKAINDLDTLLKDPAKNWGEITKKMAGMNDSLAASFKSYSDKLAVDSDKNKGKIEELRKEEEKLFNSIKEAVDFSVDTKDAMAQIGDFLNNYKKQVSSLKFEGLVPDEDVFKLKELGDTQKQLNKAKSEYEDKVESILKTETDTVKQEEKIKNLQKEMEPIFKSKLSTFKKISEETERQLKVADDYSKTSFETKRRIQGWAGSMQKANIALTKFGSDVSVIGPLVQGIGTAFGGLGKAIMAAAGPLAIFILVAETLYGIFNFLKDQDKKVKEFNKGLLGAGLQMGAVFSKTAGYLDGLQASISAASMSTLGNFRLTAEEIVDIAGAINKTVAPVKYLANQMDRVTETASKAGFFYRDLAKDVTALAINLNMASGEVTDFIGNVMYDFGSSFKSSTDTMWEFVAAQQGSSLTTNRFLSILQTATNGSAYFEEQLKTTAIQIEKLGKSSKLSGKDVENLMKGVAGVGKDLATTTIQMSLLFKGTKAKEAMRTAAEKSLSRLQIELQTEKSKKTPDSKVLNKIQDNIKITNDFITSLDKNSIRNSAALLEAQTTDVKSSFLGHMLKLIYFEGMKRGGPAMVRDLAKVYQITDDEAVSRLIYSQGKSADDLIKSSETNTLTNKEMLKLQKKGKDAAAKAHAATQTVPDLILDNLKRVIGVKLSHIAEVIFKVLPKIADGVLVIVEAIGEVIQMAEDIYDIIPGSKGGTKEERREEREKQRIKEEMFGKESALTKIFKHLHPGAMLKDMLKDIEVNKVYDKKIGSQKAYKARQIKSTSEDFQKALDVLSPYNTSNNNAPLMPGVVPRGGEKKDIPSKIQDITVPLTKVPVPAKIDTIAPIVGASSRNMAIDNTTLAATPTSSTKSKIAGNFVVNINGGDEAKVRRIVREELSRYGNSPVIGA